MDETEINDGESKSCCFFFPPPLQQPSSTVLEIISAPNQTVMTPIVDTATTANIVNDTCMVDGGGDVGANINDKDTLVGENDSSSTDSDGSSSPPSIDLAHCDVANTAVLLTGQSQDFDEKIQIEDDRKKRYTDGLKSVVVVAVASSAVVGFIVGNVTVALPFSRLRGRQIHVFPTTNDENDLKFRMKELERHLKESSKTISTSGFETAKLSKKLHNLEQKVTHLEETLEQATQSHNAVSKSPQNEIKQLTESINKLKMEHKEEFLRLKTALDERRLTMVQMDELETRYKEANEKLVSAESETSQLRGQQRKVNGHLALIEMSLEKETSEKHLLQSRTEQLQQQLRVSLDKITELEQNRDAIHLDLGEKAIALLSAQKEVQKLSQTVKELEKTRREFSTQHLQATAAEITPIANEELRKLQQQLHLSWEDLHTWGIQGLEKTHMKSSSKQNLRSTVAETKPNGNEELLHLSWKDLHTMGVQLPN